MSRAHRKRTPALLCLLYWTLALASPICSAASVDLNLVDEYSLQNILSQDIYNDNLQVKPGQLSPLPGAESFKGNIAATAGENEITVVPLPAAIWLFGSTLVGFVMMSNRRSP
jgi:hypothetical protein